MRYGTGHWVLYTDKTVAAVRDEIRSIPSLVTANILIIQFDPKAADGWLQKWIWEWMHKPR
jgi:hypothetical protein